MSLYDENQSTASVPKSSKGLRSLQKKLYTDKLKNGREKNKNLINHKILHSYFEIKFIFEYLYNKRCRWWWCKNCFLSFILMSDVINNFMKIFILLQMHSTFFPLQTYQINIYIFKRIIPLIFNIRVKQWKIKPVKNFGVSLILFKWF